MRLRAETVKWSVAVSKNISGHMTEHAYFPDDVQ